MDHTHYRYSARPTRSPWRIPNRADVIAGYVVLFLEHWELDPPADSHRDPRLVGEFGSFSPDYRSWTQREYGLRIGIFRVIDALRANGIRPCIAANAQAVERLPDLVALFNGWGCEWIGHGLSATRMMHARMSENEQREHIETALSTIGAVCGQRPLGWLSQDWGTTPQTFQLLAESGIRFTLDWPNDDQPYRLTTRPELLSVPLSAEWDDVQCQWLRHMEPRQHAALALSAINRLRTEGVASAGASVFGLGLHPWVSGMSSRIAALRSLLAELKQVPDVWWTQPGEIAVAAARSLPS